VRFNKLHPHLEIRALVKFRKLLQLREHYK